MSAGTIDHQTTEPMRITLRKRNIKGQTIYFVPFANHVDKYEIEDTLDQHKADFPSGYITFEPGVIVMTNHRGIHHRHVLWVARTEHDAYLARIRASVKDNQLALNAQQSNQPKNVAAVQHFPKPIPKPAPKPEPQQVKRRSIQPPLPPFLIDGNGHRYYFDELSTKAPVRDEDIEYEPPDPVIESIPKQSMRTGCCKRTKHKCIYRLDYPTEHMHGYRAVVTWQNKTYRQFFSDKASGDGLGALADALEWRNEKEREVGKPRTNAHVIGKAMSNTGYLGVSRMLVKGKDVYQVSWKDSDGRSRHTTVSINKYGQKRALRRAIQIRREGERQRIGT